MRKLVLAALLAGSVLTAVSAGSAVAAPAGAAAQVAAARHAPVAFDCRGWSAGQVRPSVIALDCYGTALIRAAGWEHWGDRRATARDARLRVNSCQPDCWHGTYRKYAAVVTLYRLRSHDGARYYSRLRLAYTHHGWRHYTYRWSTYPGAAMPVWVGGPSRA